MEFFVYLIIGCALLSVLLGAVLERLYPIKRVYASMLSIFDAEPLPDFLMRLSMMTLLPAVICFLLSSQFTWFSGLMMGLLTSRRAHRHGGYLTVEDLPSRLILWGAACLLISLTYLIRPSASSGRAMNISFIFAALVMCVGAALFGQRSAELGAEAQVVGLITLITATVLALLTAALLYRQANIVHALDESTHAALLADELPQIPTPGEPLDLDDETGYCELCGRFSPSREGQCVTCGSVVHAH